MRRFFYLVFLLLFILSACSKQEPAPITVAINPWAGYELLYLAEVKGFFNEEGANIQLVQLDSLSDVQQAYLNGHVDGLASTLIEAVQIGHLGGDPIKIVLVPDFSNGGDVIIGSPRAGSMSELKGKKIGVEVSSLGIFLLQRALEKQNLSLHDVDVINTTQNEGHGKLSRGDIDALVSYAPFSLQILNDMQYKIIFSSKDIPFEIIDTVSISQKILDENPKLVDQLRRAWQKSLDYMNKNKEDAYAIMAKREGVSSAEFTAALSDLMLLSIEDQEPIFRKPENLVASMRKVCQTLVDVKAIDTDCKKQPNIVWDK